MFTVCVLFYGNHLDLATRVLHSLDSHWRVKEFRLGLNSVSAETLSFVRGWAEKTAVRTEVAVYQAENNINVGKYPLMRRMFHLLATPSIMWFDDDSYLANANKSWWDSVHVYAEPHAVFGSLHRIKQRNKQYEAIAAQPWYTGKVIPANHIYRFATGGWWVAKSDLLTKWNYPFDALKHNGGDSILGELVRQRGLTLGAAPPTLARCHCEACSRTAQIDNGGAVVHINVGGRAGRRGIGVSNEQYVFADGNPMPDLAHQDFKTTIQRYGGNYAGQ
jgi:hypothetical protein